MSFQVTRTLAFGDCDPSGIAYFPSYLHLMVGVTEAFFADIGHPWPDLMHRRGISLPTVRLDVTFAHPGRHGDVLTFALAPRAIGRSSLDLAHRISCDGRLLWRADQRVVATAIDTAHACPWPDDLRDSLSARLEPDDA